MKCTGCNAELSDGARFCPYCGQAVAAPASQEPDTQAPAPQEPAAQAPAPQEPAYDPNQTEILDTYDPNVTTPMTGTYDPNQTKTLDSYNIVGAQEPDQDQQRTYAAHAETQILEQYPSGQLSSGQPEQPQQPQQAQPYGMPQQQAFGGVAPAQSQPQGQAYDSYGQPTAQPQDQQPFDAYGPLAAAAAADTKAAAKGKKKTPIIIAIVVAVVIVAVLGVCFAMGVGPFGGGSRLDPKGDPLEQLDAALQDIQDSKNFQGVFSMKMEMDMGDLGTMVGTSNMSVSMNGDYTMRNYDPKDMSKFEMTMNVDMDYMGEPVKYTVDYANGEAKITENGETYTMSYTPEEMAEMLGEVGGASYDSSTLRDYVKSSRIEGDTIIIELNDDFINETMSSSLTGSGISGAETTVNGLELRAKVGNGQVIESMDMDFSMSYLSYDVKAKMQMEIDLKKL